VSVNTLLWTESRGEEVVASRSDPLGFTSGLPVRT
jgi:hypothetical protein